MAGRLMQSHASPARYDGCFGSARGDTSFHRIFSAT
jgi:hypothetical protein